MKGKVKIAMEKKHSFHYLKFFAILLVVCAHTDPFANITIGMFKSKYIFYVLSAFGRVAIPFFFITSGYLFGEKFSYIRTKTKFFKRYLIQIIKLFIVWWVFYLFFNFALVIVRSVSTGVNVKMALLAYINSHHPFSLEQLYYGSNTVYHLWYLTALIWSVVILFIFIRINKVKLLLIMSLLLHLFGLTGQSYSVFLNLGINTEDALFYGLFYVTLGYYLFQSGLHKKIQLNSKMLFMLFLMFSALQSVEAAFIVIFYKGFLGVYYLFTIPSAVCLILFALKNNDLGKGSLLSKIARRTEFIYVIHPVPISVVMTTIKLLNLDYLLHTLLWQTFYTPFIFAAAYYLHPAHIQLKTTANKFKQKASLLLNRSRTGESL